MDKLTLDASVRQDYGNADGSFAGTTQASNFDVNGDGIIQQTERSVSLVDVANQNPVNYDWSYTRSEEHTSELQSLMRISYAVFCLKIKNRLTVALNILYHIIVLTVSNPYTTHFALFS